MPDLAAIEAWFQNFIVDPAPDVEVYRRQARQASRLVRPSRTLNPVERVDIYRGQYLLRMEESLGADYPGLKHFLGDDGFFHFISHYVQEHPSRSYNLGRLSDDVPACLAASKWGKRPAFVAELALLELTICQVFDAPPSTLLTQDDVAAVPEASWPTMRVRLVEAFRLLSLQYPVNEYLSAVQQDKPIGSTARRRNYLVVWRHKYDMWRLAVSPAEFRLLSDLNAGRTLGEALQGATTGRQRMDAQEIFRSFTRWVSEGFFAAVE